MLPLDNLRLLSEVWLEVAVGVIICTCEWSLLKKVLSGVVTIITFRGFFDYDYLRCGGRFNLNLFFLVSNLPFISYFDFTFYESIPVLKNMLDF